MLFEYSSYAFVGLGPAAGPEVALRMLLYACIAKSQAGEICAYAKTLVLP